MVVILCTLAISLTPLAGIWELVRVVEATGCLLDECEGCCRALRVSANESWSLEY